VKAEFCNHKGCVERYDVMGNTWHSHYVGTPFLKIAHHSNMICCAQRLNWMIHFWLFTLMPNKGLESTTKNMVGRVIGNTDCFVWPNLNFRGYFHIYTHKCNTPAWLMHPRGSNAIHMCYIVSWCCRDWQTSSTLDNIVHRTSYSRRTHVPTLYSVVKAFYNYPQVYSVTDVNRNRYTFTVVTTKYG